MRKALGIIVLAVGGCAGLPPGPVGPVTLLGPQLQQQDAQLVGQHFRTLLDFEHAEDAAFVDAATPGATDGHTGMRSFYGGGASMRVNVGSILFGTTLPGDWTLLGGYVRPATGGDVTVTLLADGKTICHNTRPVPAGAWAFVAVDLTDAACAAGLAHAGKITLAFDTPGPADLDDVLLVNNTRTLVKTDAWTVTTRGLGTDVVAKTWKDTLAAGGRDGWTIDEANGIRLRAHDLSGRTRTLLIDGRQVADGVMSVAGGEGEDLTASHRTPGDLTIDDAFGRLDRETPGDADNDGYNEQRAAYQVVAHTPRVSLTLRPRSTTIACPVLEFRGLPAGPVTATAAGKLIDGAVRLDDGTVLILIPLRIDSATEVTVSTSGN